MPLASESGRPFRLHRLTREERAAYANEQSIAEAGRALVIYLKDNYELTPRANDPGWDLVRNLARAVGEVFDDD